MPQDPIDYPSDLSHAGLNNASPRNISIDSNSRGLRHTPVRPFPGFGQAVLLLLAVGFIQVLIGLAILLLGMGRHPLAVSAITSLIVTALVIVYAPGKTGAGFSEIFPFAAVRLPVLIGSALAAIGIHILLTDATRLVTWVLPPPKILAQILGANELRRRAGVWEWFTVVALVAPFTEEILFRGLILYGFLKRYGVGKAIWASALLFALMHGNPWQFPGAIGFGIFLAWLFVKTHSLVPCLLAHMANNSVALLRFATSAEPPSNTSTTPVLVLQPLWVDAIGVLLVFGAIYFLKRLFERDRIPVGAS